MIALSRESKGGASVTTVRTSGTGIAGALAVLAQIVLGIGIGLGAGEARAESEATLASQRAAPTCRFKRGALPSQTLGEDVVGVRDRRTGKWLRPGDIPIEKIVVLMLENRSFDHYYGRLPEYLRQHFPTHPGAKPGGIDVPPPGASNPVEIGNPRSQVVRWHRAQRLCHSDTNHEWWGSHFQWNGGKMNGFVQSNEGHYSKKQPRVPRSELAGARAMSYYDHRDLPFYYQLAATFAIGDRYFSSVIGPTWPNRNFLYGATSRGLTYNTAVETRADLARDLAKDPAILFDQLSAANISWRIYIDGDALTSRVPRIGSFTGPLGLLRRLFPQVDAAVRTFWSWVAGLPGKVQEWVETLGGKIKSLSFKSAYDYLQARVAEAWQWAGKFRDAPGKALQENPLVRKVQDALAGLKSAWENWKVFSAGALSGAKAVYDALVNLRTSLANLARSADAASRGMTSPFSKFLEDARNGQLPAVSFIDPNVREDVNSTDEHPPANVQKGQHFTWQVVRALMTGPDWKKTVLFINYDEHGGYYDHVPPPRACPPDAFTGDPKRYTSKHPGTGGVKFSSELDAKFTGAFHRYGIRVPLIVVSPWVKKHYVSHRVYDHTSVLRFIQAKFNLPALSSRDANADPMFDFFDFTHHDDPARAPSADVRASIFPEPPIDRSRHAECERIFKPGKRTVNPASFFAVAADPFKDSSHRDAEEMVKRTCAKLEPGVCDWSRKLTGKSPEVKAPHELPMPNGNGNP
jgi:phospholipase C